MKYRIIWDDCTPTAERRETTADDIYCDIHVVDGDNLEELFDIVNAFDLPLDDDEEEEARSSEEKMKEAIVEICENVSGDYGDGSPNVFYLEIDGECFIDGGYESTEGVDFKTVSEDELKDYMIEHDPEIESWDDEEDYGEDLDEELNESKVKSEGDKIASYNKGLELAKKINKPVVYGYTKAGGKFYELEPKEYHGDDAAFRSQYSANVVCVAYPDKDFVKEDLREDYDELGIDQELLDMLNDGNNFELHEDLNDKKQRCIDMYNQCKEWDDKATTRVSCLCNVDEDVLKEWLNESK